MILDDLATAYWSFFLTRFSHAEIGILVTFVFHELVYFACYAPWFLVECLPFLKKYKLQAQFLSFFVKWGQEVCVALRIGYLRCFANYFLPRVLPFPFISHLSSRFVFPTLLYFFLFLSIFDIRNVPSVGVHNSTIVH